MPSVRFVTHPDYDIGLFGIERLHPFDTKKYSRALALTRERVGPDLDALLVQVDRPANEAELQLVHSPAYLKRLRRSFFVARILELAPVGLIPNRLVDRALLHPMRLATRGTLMAAALAFEHGIAVNLAGGYHHAKADSGEGFCIYNDIAIAIRALRVGGLLAEDDTVLYVDLDVHQGNGVAAVFEADPSVKLFDIFGGSLSYPNDPSARARVDRALPLPAGITGRKYLEVLRAELPEFLDQHAAARFCVYNAGTDIFALDPLGEFRVDEESVALRDRFVLDEMRGRKIPCVMLPSGGYTDASHRLIANTLCALAGLESN